MTNEVPGINSGERLVRSDLIRAALDAAGLDKVRIVPDYSQRWGGWEQTGPAFAVGVHEWDIARFVYHLAMTCTERGLSKEGAQLVKDARTTADPKGRPLVVFLGWRLATAAGEPLHRAPERVSPRGQSNRR